MFYVGQKVICTDARPGLFVKGNGEMHGLELGRIYSVRAVGLDPYWGSPGLWLVEIVRPVRAGFESTGEVGFHQARFRPVVVRKTDISIFKAMLEPNPERVEALWSAP